MRTLKRLFYVACTAFLLTSCEETYDDKLYRPGQLCQEYGSYITPATLNPVSSTHIDVYKRQVRKRLLTQVLHLYIVSSKGLFSWQQSIPSLYLSLIHI